MKRTIPELLESFVGGDQTAFTALVQEYHRKVYSVAFRLLGNHLDADEVVQETFVRVYKRQKEIAHVSNFASFVVRIATNYAIDLLRKRKGHASIVDNHDLLPGAVQLELSKRVRTPGDLYEDRALMKEITLALDMLPPRQKLTAILHDVEGYTKPEIAFILNCPEATVRSNLHIARTKLRKLLTRRLNAKE